MALRRLLLLAAYGAFALFFAPAYGDSDDPRIWGANDQALIGSRLPLLPELPPPPAAEGSQTPAPEAVPPATRQPPAAQNPDSSHDAPTDFAPLSPPGDIDIGLAGHRILAFYGKPGARSMGILGEYPKEELARLLFGYARMYSDAENGTGIIPAFYIIYGACWPGGEIGYLRDSVVREWVDYAASQGIIVFLDHQIGKFGVDQAMARLLPWLASPNVHLALDPEWRTTEPMRTIGSISAEELNQAQSMMAGWLSGHELTDERLLVVHQFTSKMIRGRDRVRSDYAGVRLIHTADGFGNPDLKRNSYAWNAKAFNMPHKGFKLFFKTWVRGAGYDEPLLTPTEVLALNPVPDLIIYQ
jgi:hypothetical protein